ncbi:MAG: AMIN domain-containing protein [Acidobacteriia bacterium]|nr:AMIN domain-containing protein [Terriglobia bacterium]
MTAQSSSFAELKAIRQSAVEGATRVVIEVSGEFEYSTRRLHEPERVYFDFPKTKPRIGLQSTYSREFQGGLASRVRVAETSPGVTRVVLDLVGAVDISTTRLANPAQLVIELRPAAGPAPPTLTSSSTLGGDTPPSAPRLGEPLLKPVDREAAPAAPSAPEPAQSAPSPQGALRISPASAAPGSTAAVRVELDFPLGAEPVALQWEISYPSPQLGLEEGDLVIGSAASSVGKSLACAGRVESAGVYVYRCVLAGGQKRVSNGPVALVNFRVRPQAQPGPATVRLSNAVGVSIDLSTVKIPPVEADVVIR